MVKINELMVRFSPSTCPIDVVGTILVKRPVITHRINTEKNVNGRMVSRKSETCRTKI